MNETLIIKHSVINSPHILAAGSFDTILTGSSDTLFTEQLLTPVKIPIGTVRGSPKILLQCELLDPAALVDGVGICELRTKGVSLEGFQVIAIHNLPDAEAINIRVTWFAFGYEAGA